MKKVRGLDFGADVTLSIEGGNSDGRFGIKERYDVTHTSIYVSLLREKEKKGHTVRSSGLGFSVCFRFWPEASQSRRQMR